MSRCIVDRLTYSIVLQREFARLLPIERFEDIAMAKARENVSRAFILDATLDDLAYQKDKDDERTNDWTR